MSDGKLIVGMWPKGVERPDNNSASELRANIAKTFFGFGLPALWRASRNYAFVIDSGFGCDADKPLDNYLDDATMDATGAFFDGRRYYLVHPARELWGHHQGGPDPRLGAHMDGQRQEERRRVRRPERPRHRRRADERRLDHSGLRAAARVRSRARVQGVGLGDRQPDPQLPVRRAAGQELVRRVVV
jgi:hypothetical protein